MSDDEVLAEYRQIHPHTSMSQAKEVYRTWLKFRHLGATKTAKDRVEAIERDRQLRGRLFGVGESRDDEGRGRT